MAKETIRMMGDSSNYMLEAQRDMLELEVEYFQKQSIKFTIGLLIFVVGCVIMAALHNEGYINVF
jgi:hypothetical protein